MQILGMRKSWVHVDDRGYKYGVGLTLEDVLAEGGYTKGVLSNVGPSGIESAHGVVHPHYLGNDKLVLLEYGFSWLTDELTSLDILWKIREHIFHKFPKGITHMLNIKQEDSPISIPENNRTWARIAEMAFILFHSTVTCNISRGETMVFGFNIRLESDEPLTKEDIDKTTEMYWESWENGLRLGSYEPSEVISIWSSKYFSDRMTMLLEGLLSQDLQSKKPLSCKLIKYKNNDFELILNKN